MRVAQRDLLRITSTFQAMKLLESYYYGQKGEHNNYMHSRWQPGMNKGADEHSIMGGKIGIMCVSLTLSLPSASR